MYRTRRAFAGLAQILTVPAGGDVPGLAVVRDDLAGYESPRELAIEVIRDLAADYYEKRRRDLAGWRLVGTKRGVEYEEITRWEAWANILRGAMVAAQELLIEAVLTINGKDYDSSRKPDRGSRDEGWEWDAVSFELDGRNFVVSQTPGEEGEFKPVLTIVDIANADADWQDE